MVVVSLLEAIVDVAEVLDELDDEVVLSLLPDGSDPRFGVQLTVAMMTRNDASAMQNLPAMLPGICHFVLRRFIQDSSAKFFRWILMIM